MAGWLGGWVAGWLGGWVAGWLGGWVAEWLAGWQVGGLAGWRAGIASCIYNRFYVQRLLHNGSHTCSTISHDYNVSLYDINMLLLWTASLYLLQRADVYSHLYILSHFIGSLSQFKIIYFRSNAFAFLPDRGRKSERVGNGDGEERARDRQRRGEAEAKTFKSVVNSAVDTTVALHMRSTTGPISANLASSSRSQVCT